MNKLQVKEKQDELDSRIKFYEEELNYFSTEMNKAQFCLDSMKGNICFFQFETHQDAEDSIIEVLQDKAHNDCEGSNNRGNDVYEQGYQLIDSDAVYLGRIKVEYNRHDKTYYFVDEVEYSYSEVKIRS